MGDVLAVADRPDQRDLLARGYVSARSGSVHPFDDRLNVFRGGRRVHYDHHRDGSLRALWLLLFRIFWPLLSTTVGGRAMPDRPRLMLPGTRQPR